MIKNRVYELIGAAYGLGSSRQGPRLGPLALRANGLLEKLRAVAQPVLDGGDIEQPAASGPGENPKLKFVSEARTFCEALYVKALGVHNKGNFPVLLGGDHSISIGSISAAAAQLRSKLGPASKLGLLWVDAHADLHTPETTLSGNLHGMSVAVLLGMGDNELAALGGFRPKLKPEHVVYIGLRDLEQAERARIKELNIKSYSMHDIDRLGAGAVCAAALTHLNANTDAFVLSFDLDACEPEIAPGVGTPVRGGLTLRESHLIMELAAQCEKLISAEIVELNPELDRHEMTEQVALWLLESALGKSILD